MFEHQTTVYAEQPHPSNAEQPHRPNTEQLRQSREIQPHPSNEVQPCPQDQNLLDATDQVHSYQEQPRPSDQEQPHLLNGNLYALVHVFDVSVRAWSQMSPPTLDQKPSPV